MNKRPVGQLVFFSRVPWKSRFSPVVQNPYSPISLSVVCKIHDSTPGNLLKMRSHYYRWSRNIVWVSHLPFPWSKRERARGRQGEKERSRKLRTLRRSKLGRKSSNAEDYATSAVKEHIRTFSPALTGGQHATDGCTYYSVKTRALSPHYRTI